MSRIPVALSLARALVFRFPLLAVPLLAIPAVAPTSAQAFEWLGHIEIEADGLANDDPQTRLAAVRALSRYDIEWTREHLMSALGDADVHVRTAAGRALAEHNEVRALPIIIKWLAQPDAQSKRIAAVILGDMRAQGAVPALVRALGDPDEVVRINSLVALGKIGGNAVIVPLVTRLEDDKADVRLVAVQQLQKLKDSRAVIPLVGLFRDASQTVRVAAIAAVGSLGDAGAAEALLRELDDRDEGVQIAAVTSLGNLQSDAALPQLIAVMNKANTALRSKAAFSLAEIAKAHPENPRSGEALGLLVEALGDPRLRMAAEEALRNAGSTAVPHLIDVLDGKRRGDPESAVRLLQVIGDADATPALIRELARGRIAQSVTLAALASIGDSRALLPMLALLDDPSAEVRLGAMRSMENLLGGPSAAADIMADRLGDSNLEIRLMAARYLGRMGATSSVPALIAIAKDSSDIALQATALQALGKIRDPRATSVALQTLGGNNAAIRAVAADVLSELADPAAVSPLLAIADKPYHDARVLAVEALGATLRGTKHARAGGIFLKFARGPGEALSLAAIEALSGMRDDRSGPVLMQLAAGTDPERKRAAILALGSLAYQPAATLLTSTLRDQTPQMGAAAALALSQLGTTDAVSTLLRACLQSDPARAINASAALAVLGGAANTKGIAPLLRHGNALVRVNALAALARIGDTKHRKSIEAIAAHDSSWLVRIAAIRALSQLGTGSEAIEKASKDDYRREVRDAATAVLTKPFAPATDVRWSVFRIVDPLRDDQPVAHEGRFFVGSDGIARVGHSDSRGRIYYQKFPEGDFWQGPLSSLAGF